MGKWKFSEGAYFDQENLENILDMSIGYGGDEGRTRSRKNLAKAIETSFQPTETGEKPSDQAVSIASELVLKYVNAYISLRHDQENEDFQSLSDEERSILRSAVDQSFDRKYVAQITGELLNHYISGSAGRKQEAEAARELFDSLSKVATKASLKDFATVFSESQSHDSTRARSWLDNLVRQGTMPEEVAKNIKITLDTDEKARLFMRWHGTTDFAAVVDKETAPLNIFKIMQDEKVMSEALTRAYEQ